MTTRVAIYARVSTGEQSPEAQLRELRLYAEHRGFPITREYVDQASGDVRKRRRAPEFEALMADARRRVDSHVSPSYPRGRMSHGRA